MSKVIFLDIDGPLAYGTWMEGPITIDTFSLTGKHFTIPYPWVQEDCDALTEILEKTDASLVISSDWRRFYTLAQLRGIASHFGINPYLIIDTTTQYNPGKKMSSSGEWDRACEIKAWIKAFRPEHWIAIDDFKLSFSFKRLGIPKWRHVDCTGLHGEGKRLREAVGECVSKLNR